MEDLWRFQRSGVELEDYADYAEYRKFLKRFNDEEENTHQRQLLYENKAVPATDKRS